MPILMIAFGIWIILRFFALGEEDKRDERERQRKREVKALIDADNRRIDLRRTEVRYFMHTQMRIYCPIEDLENFCYNVAVKYPTGNLEYLKDDPFLLEWQRKEAVRLKALREKEIVNAS